METNLFEIATRKHFKFPSSVGLLATEDLWELSLNSTKINTPNLNSVAQAVNAELNKVDGVVDFVNPSSSKGSTLAAELAMKLDVVKHIIAVRVAEQDLAKAAIDKKARNDKIMDLIAKKKDNALETLSIEELTKMLG